MLATLNRHQGRLPEAREHLRRLQRLERACDWNLEIEREWKQLGRMESSGESDDSVPHGQDNEDSARQPAA